MTKNKGGRPAFFKTQEELQEKIEQYFKEEVGYEEVGDSIIPKPPTVAGLALYLGFSDRASLYDYKNRDEFSHIIKRAVSKIEEYAEKALLNGKGGTGSIFWLKNHGWADKQNVEHTGEGGGPIIVEISTNGKKD